MIADFTAPHIDYAGLSPVIALTAGLCIVLIAGVFDSLKRIAPELAILTLGATAGLAIWQWDSNTDLVAGALRLDPLALGGADRLPRRRRRDPLRAARPRHTTRPAAAEFCTLVLGSVLGMTIFVEAQNLVSFFVGLELLSIPLYILCGRRIKRASSLESGLKYLVIGSLGSATLLYGLALLYGGGGSTDFSQIAAALNDGAADDSLVLIGTAMVLTGLAFKTSLAPFHQWTPDVYEGAPTAVTAFMAVATKAAAFIAFVRLFEVALGPLVDTWDTGLAALAAISIVVGNAGALKQDSLKRLLGYSGIAQAGYMLAGIVVANETGLEALVFYLAAYCLMNLAVFGVVIARERETGAATTSPPSRASAPAAPARLAADDRDARARRPARDLRLHGQAVPDRGGGRRPLHLARGADRDRLDDLARLLHARHRGDVDEADAGGDAGDRRRCDGRGARRARAPRARHRRRPEPGPARGPGTALRRGDDRLRRRARSADRLGPPRGDLAEHLHLSPAR